MVLVLCLKWFKIGVRIFYGKYMFENWKIYVFLIWWLSIWFRFLKWILDIIFLNKSKCIF